MSNNKSGGLFTLIRSILNWLFGNAVRPPVQPPAPVPPDSDSEPVYIANVRVLVVVYDPIVEDTATGQKLSEYMGWQNVEHLIDAYTADIVETSGGVARYQVIERIDVDEFPVKADGFRYTSKSYLDVVRRVSPPHSPDLVNYSAILNQFNITERVVSDEVDEVWFFAFPYAGFYESVMAGAGAFWCNAGPLMSTTSCPKRFVLMGFSYERGVGEMLEAFGHRAESMLEKAFSHTRGAANLYEKFSRYDKIAPGQSEVGTIHFAPNSEHDYDWGNSRVVKSHCDDWYNFPDFKGTARQVDAREWGSGDIRAHHKWWLNHLPKVSGRQNGIANNWWQYIMEPNRVSV